MRDELRESTEPPDERALRRGAALSSILAAALVVAGGGGCSPVLYVNGPPGAGEPVEVGVDYYLYGLVGEGTVDAVAACPRGADRIEVIHSAVDVTLSTATLGIYTPLTVRLWCGDEASGP